LIRLRHIPLLIVFLFFVARAFSQNEQQMNDSLLIAPESKEQLIDDSLLTALNDSTDRTDIDSTKKEKQVFESPISYNATDSMAVSLEEGDQVVYLYGGANIKYGTIELTADYISVN